MPPKKSTTLTDVELGFMEILWERGELSPEETKEALAENGRVLTGGSVRKMLLVLVKKGYVVRRKEGKKYIYRAVIDNKAARKHMVGDLLDRAFGGSAAQMVAALFDHDTVPEHDIAYIETLIKAHKTRSTE